ncbi:MAG: archaellin/type IV pilin N-terminal domain-containing protein [Candidatus Aenigmatarchaeota archaeon]
MKKGLSPLIATVLLVAFTMAVAIVLSNWVLDYSKAQTQVLDTRGSQQVGCSGAWLDADSAVYNTTARRFSTEIVNKGNVPLGEFKMIIIYNNGTSNEYIIAPANLSLGPGVPVSIQNVSVDSSAITRVRIPHNCSGSNAAATATIEYANIKVV